LKAVLVGTLGPPQASRASISEHFLWQAELELPAAAVSWGSKAPREKLMTNQVDHVQFLARFLRSLTHTSALISSSEFREPH